jgi:hypothetical protein
MARSADGRLAQVPCLRRRRRVAVRRCPGHHDGAADEVPDEQQERVCAVADQRPGSGQRDSRRPSHDVAGQSPVKDMEPHRVTVPAVAGPCLPPSVSGTGPDSRRSVREGVDPKERPITEEAGLDAGILDQLPGRSRSRSSCCLQRLLARQRWWSVDVELVALRVFHCDRLVVDPFLLQDPDHRGAQLGQPSGLGIDSLPAD